MKGTKLNERFRSSETVEKAEVDEKKFNFLYIDGENCHFMDNATFEQVEIPKSISGEKYKLFKGKFRGYNFIYGRINQYQLSFPTILNVKLKQLMLQ